MYRIETIENQRKAILPMNDISATIFYNQRVIISAPIPEPTCWRVTKVEDVSPNGVRRLTFAQSQFDQHHDYIERDAEGNVIGMWANYWDSSVRPESQEQDTSFFITTTSKITASGKANQLRIGGSKTFTVSFYEDENPVEHNAGTWLFTMDEQDVSDLLSISYPSDNKVRIKFNGDDSYIGKILTATNKSGEITSSYDVEIIAL